MSTKKHILKFLTDTSLKTFSAARQFIISIRNESIPGFTLFQSRSLWASLLLYKFRSEHEIPDTLWQASRKFILETLRDQEQDISIEYANAYLQLFADWKESDLEELSNEIIGYYIHVLHLKEYIEETKEEETISEWRTSYQQLLIKIRSAAERLGIIKKLDEQVDQMNQMRESIVRDMMRRAYWDMIEDDIRHQRYTSVYCQLVELKDLLS